jgi:glycosyltransferase involved in cell wall biosynthesis
VIVADSSDDNTKNIIRNKYPSVNLISFDKKTDPGTERNAGIEKARGSIIAFTDSDCIVPENWLEEYYKIYSNNRECLAAGGSLKNANAKTLSSVAGYFIEFSDYMPEVPSGAVLSLPTSNISFRKEIFDKYGGYKPEFYPQEDYYFNWKLHKGGDRLYFFPEIEVKHFHRDTALTFMEHQFRFGIITARILKFTDLPGHFFVKKPFTLAPLFIPLLPFVKFFRTSKRVLIYDPDMALKRPLLFPMMMIGLLSWGIGFAFGVYEKDTNRKL